MMTRLITAMLAVIFGYASADADEIFTHTFVYVRWVGREVLAIERSSRTSAVGRIVIGKDASFEAQFCRSESGFDCFFSPVFSFAVPRCYDGSVSKWTVHGIDFEVIDRHVRMRIFGRELTNLFVIRAPPGATEHGRRSGRPSDYLFSPEFGLVGFSSYGVGPTYWLAGEYGFGRPCSCANRLKGASDQQPLRAFDSVRWRRGCAETGPAGSSRSLESEFAVRSFSGQTPPQCSQRRRDSW
jgi:hypothetical protein